MVLGILHVVWACSQDTTWTVKVILWSELSVTDLKDLEKVEISVKEVLLEDSEMNVSQEVSFQDLLVSRADCKVY